MTTKTTRAALAALMIATSGFALGGVYGAAMAFVYGILGLVVVLTAGTFGTLNASPWFNIAIAVVFVGLALAVVGAIAFAGKGIIIKLAYRHGVDAVTLIGLRMLMAAPFTG